jgi:EF-hand domain pair/Chloroplast import apparatus Tic20-like
MKLSTANNSLQSSITIFALVLATTGGIQAFTASPPLVTRSSNSAAASSFMMATPQHPSSHFIRNNNLQSHHQIQNNNKAFRSRRSLVVPLQATAAPPPPGETTTDEEVERLQAMAAKLRAEAAQLQAKQQQAMTQAATKAFEKFDTNRDGQIDLPELRVALEKTFKLNLDDDDQQQQVLLLQKVMSKFDTNGDGVLTRDEFVFSMDQVKNQLDQVIRQEKEQSRRTIVEEQAAAQINALLQAQIELINDGEPSMTDKVVSVLPYLFPLLDGLQYARFFVLDNPESPLALAAGVLYGLYRSIPLGGFLAFFALSFLSGNLSLNRLVRFNMQQAIFLDIALVIPGLLLGLASIIASGGGATAGAPATLALVQQLGSDVVFLSLLAVLAYTTVSSLAGIEPDQIPFISEAVQRRMPSVKMFLDAQGRFSPLQSRTIDEKEKKPDDDNSTTDQTTAKKD